MRRRLPNPGAATFAAAMIVLLGTSVLLLRPSSPDAARASSAAVNAAPTSPCVITGTKWVHPETVSVGDEVSMTLRVAVACPVEPWPYHVVFVLDESSAVDRRRLREQPIVPVKLDPVRRAAASQWRRSRWPTSCIADRGCRTSPRPDHWHSRSPSCTVASGASGCSTQADRRLRTHSRSRRHRQGAAPPRGRRHRVPVMRAVISTSSSASRTASEMSTAWTTSNR